MQAIVNQRLGAKPAASNGVDLNALADAVIRGEYGVGAERRAKLGANYDKGQQIVNPRLG